MLKDVLRDTRTEKGLKQEDVANLVKVAKQTYLKWENGVTEPKASQIMKLAKVLDITAEEICLGKRNTRYSLEEFIARLAYYRASREIEVMEAWAHISDHKAFFDSINHNNVTRYEELQKEKEQLLLNNEI